MKHVNKNKGGDELDKDDFNAILRVLLTLRRWRNESLLNGKAKSPDGGIANDVNASKTHENAVEKP